MGRRKPRFGKTFPVGLVVWARYPGFPWWPSLVVDRAAVDRSLDAGEHLPPARDGNRTLEFFNDNKRVGVCAVADLAEYTRGLRKFESAGADDEEGVLQACKEAHAYIRARGAEAQRLALAEADYKLPGEETWGGDAEAGEAERDGAERADATQAGESEDAAERADVSETSVPGGEAGGRDSGGDDVVQRENGGARGGSTTAVGKRKTRTRTPVKSGDWTRNQRFKTRDADASDEPSESESSPVEVERSGNLAEVLQTALSSFCAANALGGMRADDARLQKSVTLRIEVDGVDQQRTVLSRRVSIKEFAPVADAVEIDATPPRRRVFRRLWAPPVEG